MSTEKIITMAYAANTKDSPLSLYKIERRSPGDNDVLIDILYSGVCHSDIHASRGEWGSKNFPMVPGHEIIGKISQIGSKVTKFKIGESVGVGCFVDSCRTCEQCKIGDEQYCENGVSFTYDGFEQDKKTATYGGYSTKITVDENYVLKIPSKLALEKAAPLLCAGITVYSPMRYYGVKKGDKIAVLGLGGLGHMAVKIAVAMGAEVSVISRSESKRKDALDLGAKEFILSGENPKKYANHFNFIINLISAPNDYNQHLSMLKTNGTMILLGAPSEPSAIQCFSLILKRRKIGGSLIGGIKETQEMLDFCAKHNVLPEVETIKMEQINEAYERIVKGNVHYRFVIDIADFARKQQES